CYLPLHSLLFPSPTPFPSWPPALSLHDALPIFVAWQDSSGGSARPVCAPAAALRAQGQAGNSPVYGGRPKPTRFVRLQAQAHARSEDHTSELQSRGHLVCRLLLEKKKKKKNNSK